MNLSAVGFGVFLALAACTSLAGRPPELSDSPPSEPAPVNFKADVWLARHRQPEANDSRIEYNGDATFSEMERAISILSRGQDEAILDLLFPCKFRIIAREDCRAYRFPYVKHSGSRYFYQDLKQQLWASLDTTDLRFSKDVPHSGINPQIRPSVFRNFENSFLNRVPLNLSLEQVESIEAESGLTSPFTGRPFHKTTSNDPYPGVLEIQLAYSDSKTNPEIEVLRISGEGGFRTITIGGSLNWQPVPGCDVMLPALSISDRRTYSTAHGKSVEDLFMIGAEPDSRELTIRYVGNMESPEHVPDDLVHPVPMREFTHFTLVDGQRIEVWDIMAGKPATEIEELPFRSMAGPKSGRARGMLSDNALGFVVIGATLLLVGGGVFWLRRQRA